MTCTSALLVIDLQQEDGFPLERFDQVVGNAGALIGAARRLAIPVIYTRHVNNAQGHDLAHGEPVDEHGQPTSYRAGTSAVEVLDALAPHAGDQVLDKHRYSAFHGTDLAQRLRSQGIEHLVVFGVLTDVCVMTSVFDAYQHGFTLSLVADACTATTLGAHYSALMILSNWIYGLEIFSTSQLLRHWQQQPAGSVRTDTPDHFAFHPEAFVDAIQRFEHRLAHDC
ncbi:isochorismatase family cysteine hydrolase [Pseudomonas guariconensis]|uniref:cysteine hydrolase family protein n=1 Tax=Pseudomonas guariconensis TaxID=1288410 RepID=UPI002F4004E6